MAKLTKILVLNGPNLTLLGTREPQHYGSETLESLNESLIKRFPNVAFRFEQSNHEGALIEHLHAAEGQVDGVVFNPGGYSHTSVALADAMRSLTGPVIEVHISQLYQRESERQQLVTAAAADGLMVGLGVQGYHLAVEHVVWRCNQKGN